MMKGSEVHQNSLIIFEKKNQQLCFERKYTKLLLKRVKVTIKDKNEINCVSVLRIYSLWNPCCACGHIPECDFNSNVLRHCGTEVLHHH